ncbi:MAG: beta-ketoacyl-[acyl-carrier-protein] synthase family protein [Spirochaetes bacterium]|nr:beta-ketoacyl-[acyl-carrier-protein] synthase family protein [Spirochaetota bacterium]
MDGTRVFITGMGVLSALGSGTGAHVDALKENRSGIRPLGLFPASPGNLLPAGEYSGDLPEPGMPRTHRLALAAMREACAGRDIVPDAVIIGTTTGGMALTEELLRAGERDAARYLHHSTSSVAEYIAGALSCRGPVLTITTACSSGTAAIKLACELLRSGRARCVLAGGADSLCRLTYYGFNALQLIDPDGARPLDRSRRGMSVSEGAAMLLLEAAASAPANAIAEILGGGLSCDAYHPASPHPDGDGARAAMSAAIEDAGTSVSGIGYINLHGTGTVDNDRSEARAVRALFGANIPPLSSVKGATGHSLAAAGAIEAVISALSMQKGFLPANTGCIDPDPDLGLVPLAEACETPVATVLSNSFGFGGNNACLVLGKPSAGRAPLPKALPPLFEIRGGSCVTGAGDIEATLAHLEEGMECRGLLPLADISKNLPPREVRRLKRLPRLAVALAMAARDSASGAPSDIFFGTAWGPLSETNDFLAKLFESDEQYTSPTDFVGSVHNAPAGQAAIWLKATGANVTVTGGDCSFEEALFAAGLAAGSGDLLVMAADEHHEILSPLFDASAAIAQVPSDGGGALLLRRSEAPGGAAIAPLFYENTAGNPEIMLSLIAALGGPERISSDYAAIFAGMPAASRQQSEARLHEFISATGFSGAVVDYRALIGEFASSSAAAAAIAARLAGKGTLPASLAGGASLPLNGKGILILGLGAFVTAAGITTRRP